MFCVYYFSIIPRYLRHLPQIKNLLSLSERESTNLLRAELRHSKSGSTRIATGYLKMRNTDYTRRSFIGSFTEPKYEQTKNRRHETIYIEVGDVHTDSISAAATTVSAAATAVST